MQLFDTGPLDAHVWLFEYGDIHSLLKDAKYHGATAHYSHLAGVLAQSITAGTYDLCTPLITHIPTIDTHIRQRGYDHAHILCSNVARHTRCKQELLLVAAHATSQTNLERAHRRVNPHYLCTRRLSGERVFVVDDTATTRSSLICAARALKDAGASEVIGLTLGHRTDMNNIFSGFPANKAKKS